MCKSGRLVLFPTRHIARLAPFLSVLFGLKTHLTDPIGMPVEMLAQHERELTRRVLWKLDIHVLPPLAFVRRLASSTHRATHFVFVI